MSDRPSFLGNCVIYNNNVMEDNESYHSQWRIQGANPVIGPSSRMVIDSSPLQRRNKREILGNILNCPPSLAKCQVMPRNVGPISECLDLPLTTPCHAHLVLSTRRALAIVMVRPNFLHKSRSSAASLSSTRLQ